MSSLPSSSSNSAMDNFLVETLMDRLQVRDPVNNPLVSQSLEDYLYGDFEHEEDDREIIPYQGNMEEVIMEERKLEREIINIIVNGKGDSLMPNSGQSVSLLGHSICVGCEKDDHGDSMVWEWHGHISAYIELPEQYRYSLEYIYGVYTQRPAPRTRPDAAGEKKEEEEKRDQGLTDLIEESKDSSRILHRHLNARSPPRY